MPFPIFPNLSVQSWHIPFHGARSRGGLTIKPSAPTDIEAILGGSLAMFEYRSGGVEGMKYMDNYDIMQLQNIYIYVYIYVYTHTHIYIYILYCSHHCSVLTTSPKNFLGLEEATSLKKKTCWFYQRSHARATAEVIII